MMMKYMTMKHMMMKHTAGDDIYDIHMMTKHTADDHETYRRHALCTNGRITHARRCTNMLVVLVKDTTGPPRSVRRMSHI